MLILPAQCAHLKEAQQEAQRNWGLSGLQNRPRIVERSNRIAARIDKSVQASVPPYWLPLAGLPGHPDGACACAFQRAGDFNSQRLIRSIRPAQADNLCAAGLKCGNGVVGVGESRRFNGLKTARLNEGAREPEPPGRRNKITHRRQENARPGAFLRKVRIGRVAEHLESLSHAHGREWIV